MGTAALARRTRALLVAAVSASLLGLAAPSAGAVDTAPAPSTTTVTGRAVTATGTPVPQMPVSLCGGPTYGHRYTAEPSGECPVVTTDTNGTFAFNVPVPVVTEYDSATRYVQTYPLSAQVEHLLLAQTSPVAVAVTAETVSVGELVIPAAAEIRGMAVGPRGPLVGAEIRAFSTWSPERAPVHTDRDGRFVAYVRELNPADPALPWSAGIWADAPDHVRATTSLQVVAGGRYDVGTMQAALDRSFSFGVTGDVIPSLMMVHLTGPRSYAAATSTGRISDGGLDNGEYTIAVDSHDVFYTEPMKFTLSDEHKHAALTAPLLRFARASARIETPDGRAVPTAFMDLEQLVDGAWTRDGRGLVADAGSLGIDRLRAGTYRLVPSDARTAAPLPSAAGFTVAAGESRDLGVLTVEPFAMGYRHDVTITTPTVERTRVYDPDRLSVITASVASAAPLEGVEAVVLDGAGREVTSTLVTNGQLRFLMTRSAVGTHSGFRIHIPATYRSNAATSALVPPHTVTLRPTRVSTPRLSRSTVSRGGVVEVEVDVTHGDHGTLELLIDGKVAERTSMIPQGPGTTHTHLLMAPAPTVGKHTIAVRRVATATEAAATSAPAALTVTKATLRGRPKVSAKPFRAGTKPRVTVTVPQTKHRAYATGKVRLYVGKKLVRTVTLKAKHRGRITTTLPLRPGKAIQVRAVYAGSKDVVGATSKVTTIRTKPKVRR